MIENKVNKNIKEIYQPFLLGSGMQAPNVKQARFLVDFLKYSTFLTEMASSNTQETSYEIPPQY